MFSYSYQPQTMPLSSPVPMQPPMPQRQPVHGTEDRTEPIREDMVTLDSFIGVAALGPDYSFVKYKVTEKHKECGVLKINRVQQINMFIQTLRDKAIPIETCLHTLMPSSKKTLWMRVSLTHLEELSLEPLWKIKGIVQLHSKEQWVTIKMDDRALDPCVLDREQLLCAQHDRYHTEEFLRLAKEGLIDHDQEDKCDDVSDGYGYEHDANSSGKEQAGDEHTEDRVRVKQKRKTCTVGGDEATVAHKKPKTPTEGSHVSLGSEPKVRGAEKDLQERCNTPNVVHTNFNLGMQTRMKSRQQSKRGMHTMNNMKRRMHRLYNSKSQDPVSLHREDGGQSQQWPCPVPKAHTQKARAARAITSHVEPCAAVPAASHDHRGIAQRSPVESTNSDAVEQRLCDPDPESQQNPVCDLRRVEGPRTRACLLM